MTYTDDQMEAMRTNPVLLEKYAWQVAMSAQRDARQLRSRVRMTAVRGTIGTRLAAQEMFDLSEQAHHAQRFGEAILENLDVFVRGSIEPARCTCVKIPPLLTTFTDPEILKIWMRKSDEVKR